MAKTRQQRKAERRRRQQAEQASKRDRGAAEQEGQARAAGVAPGVVPEPIEPLAETTEVESPEAAPGDAVEAAEAVEAARVETAEAIEAARAEAAEEVSTGAAPADETGAPEAPAPPKEKKRSKERKREAKPARRTERRSGGVRERSRVLSFLSEVRAELRRVQWPDRRTLMQATGVVIVTVLIAATYLGVLDFIFGKLIKSIL